MSTLLPQIDVLVLDLDYTLFTHDWHTDPLGIINSIYAERLAEFPIFKDWSFDDVLNAQNKYYFKYSSDFY